MHLLHAESEPPHLVEDFVGGLDPLEGDAAFVVRLDVGEERRRSCGVRVWDPRLSAFVVSNPKNRSTSFSHDA